MKYQTYFVIYRKKKDRTRMYYASRFTVEGKLLTKLGRVYPKIHFSGLGQQTYGIRLRYRRQVSGGLWRKGRFSVQTPKEYQTFIKTLSIDPKATDVRITRTNTKRAREI